VQSKGQGHKVT